MRRPPSVGTPLLPGYNSPVPKSKGSAVEARSRPAASPGHPTPQNRSYPGFRRSWPPSQAGATGSGNRTPIGSDFTRTKIGDRQTVQTVQEERTT